MGKDGVKRSIIEILGLSIDERKANYEAVGIDYVKIGGNIYRNYSQFYFGWDKNYVTEPIRNERLAIENLNAYATGRVGHLFMDFKLMSIDDFRSIIKQDLEQNEFVVECYDTVYDTRRVLKMYLATQEERHKLRTIANRRLKNDGSWEEWVDLVGVEEYTLELIGTNAGLDKVSVIYHLNPPSDTGIIDETVGENDIVAGSDLIIGTSTTFPEETFNGKYRFKCWNISPSGGDKGNYLDDKVYTINDTLVLYAIWESTSSHTLSYSYGLSNPMVSNGQAVMSQSVQYGQPISALPTFDVSPPVVTNDGTFYPYVNGGWYKTPTLASNSTPIQGTPNYWVDASSTIYLLYQTQEYKLITDSGIDGVYFSDKYIKYNSAVSLPSLIRSGYTFEGWYVAQKYIGYAWVDIPTEEQQQFSGTMPPYDIKVVARWEQDK